MVLAAPRLLVVLLVLLLSADLAAQAADAGVGAPDRLRPGTVPAAYQDLVVRAAQTCPGITAPLLAAQLEQESGWNPNAVSPVGAQGLSQFMPGTWIGEGVDGDGDGVRDPFDPADAIASQASFMCKLFAATADGSLTGDPIDLALAGYNAGLGAVQRYNGVPPYAETQGYIVQIRNLMAKYADPAASAPGAGPPGSWVRPIQGARVTSGFGDRWGRLHAGTDFGAPIGTPVYAASNGAVTAAGPTNGYGQWVKLAHPGGTSTVYGHISAWTVTVGQAVQAGQLIAYSGNEGRSTGPHLHFETHTAGRPVDPVAFFAAHGTPLR
jgi:murein DD-endopeptidase MepM/ murein hydrolase activator NlpD